MQEFQRNVKREFGKLVSVLQAYALISTNVRHCRGSMASYTSPLPELI